MKKTYTYFEFKDLEGNTFHVACWTNYNNNGFTHNVNCLDVKARQCWCNRTWERFDYESVLRKWANKVGGDLGEYLKVQIDAIAQHEHEKAEAWFNNFKARYDNLGDTTKKHLANAMEGKIVTTQEDAESIMQISEAFDVMFKVMGKN